MKIALTTDHAGFETIGELKLFVESLGHQCINYGPKDFDPGDDYPKYMFPAAKAVASGECDLAIIMGGSGQGEAMAANRIKGVRCALFYGLSKPVQAVDAEGNESDDPYEIVKLSRQHNHANVLSLSNRFLTLDQMKQAIIAWLDTPYSEAERHIRRVRELDEF
jgi:ribose 5-phosphate isomerase B